MHIRRSNQKVSSLNQRARRLGGMRLERWTLDIDERKDKPHHPSVKHAPLLTCKTVATVAGEQTTCNRLCIQYNPIPFVPCQPACFTLFTKPSNALSGPSIIAVSEPLAPLQPFTTFRQLVPGEAVRGELIPTTRQLFAVSDTTVTPCGPEA